MPFLIKKVWHHSQHYQDFFNRMDEDTLIQFDDIDKNLRDIIYSIKRPEHMLLDLDSTLFGTYGKAGREDSTSIIRHMDIIHCCAMTG